MLWFLNNPKTNPNGMIEFYQIFVDSEIVYTDEEANTIYSFNSNNLKFNIDTTKYKSTNINCKIKIMDHIISYNMENQKTDCVFTVKTNFINPQDNQYRIPLFSHTYKQVSEKRLPNLIESEYTNIYNLNFQVYNIEQNNSQIQFIVETNLITNEKRKYFIVQDLNLIEKYHIANK